jgi:hypothetical protein
VVIGGYRSVGDDDRIEALVARVTSDGDLDVTAAYRHALGDAFVSGLAIDGMGRIAVAGAVSSEAEDWDLWVAVYEPDGTLAWSSIVAGEAGAEDQAVGIAADPDGDDLFAVGYVMQSDGTTDVWMRRFGSAGDVRWEGTHAGAFGGIDVGTDVAFDRVSGTFFVVGYETAAQGDTDVLAMSIDAAGETRWTMRADEAHGADRGQGIAPDGSGGAWVVGHAVVPGRTVDAWIGRVDAGGVLSFRVLRDGPASLGDGAADVAVGLDGTAVVGGHQFVDGQGQSQGKWHAWIEKLDAEGAPIWTHVHGGPAPGDDVVAGVAVGPEGDVYAVGSVAVTDSRREIWLRKLAG